MSVIDGTLPPNCPNCDAPVHGPYCAQCGQETAIGIPTLRQFGHEYVQTFVSLESRLWRTLWLLIRRPGLLTKEFLAGRRRRYVRPLPLYLSLSFLFFLVLTFSVGDQAGSPASAAIQIDTSGTADLTELGSDAALPQWMESLVRRYAKSSERLRKEPVQAGKLLTAAFLAKLPYAMFFLVPAFAVTTRLLYFWRRRSYPEHLLFALHVHSFFFIYLTVTQLIPGSAMAGFLLPVWCFYLTVSLREVFGGRWLPQMLRSLSLMAGHFVLLCCSIVVVLLLALPAVA